MEEIIRKYLLKYLNFKVIVNIQNTLVKHVFIKFYKIIFMNM